MSPRFQSPTPEQSNHSVARQPITYPLVGRKDELSRLRVLMQDAIRGAGRLVILIGPAGIGKTRLLTEFASTASAATVLTGRAWEEGGAPPFWPWIEALRGTSDAQSPHTGEYSDLESVVGLTPEPSTLASGTYARLTSERSRFRLFDGVVQHLSNLSARSPTLVLLEDIASADPSTVALLRFVAPRITRVRALILVTSREVAPENPNYGPLHRLRNESNCEEIFLGPLGPGDIERVLAESLPGEVPPKVTATVFERTQGNPLYLHEAIRALRSGGECPALEEWVPRSFRHEIHSRLADLTAETRAVACAGAVIGRSFELDAAGGVLGFDRQSVLNAVDALVAEGLLEQDPAAAASFRFKHELIRDGLYLATPLAERSRLHERVATYLEESEAIVGPAGHASRIARHYVLGAPAVADARSVWHHIIQAGDSSTESLAYEEAARLYQTSIEFATSQQDILVTLLKLGHANTRSGNAPRGRECYRQAAAISVRLGDSESLAKAALGYAEIPDYGQVNLVLVGLLESALASIPNALVGVRALLMASLSAALYWTDPETSKGGLEYRRSLALRAVELARSTGDPAIISAAMTNAYLSCWTPDNLEEREAMVAEIIGTPGAPVDSQSALQTLGWRMIDSLEGGNVHEADACLDEYVRLAEDSNQPSFLFWAVLWRSMRALMRGKYSISEGLRQEAVQLGDQCQDQSMFSNACLSQFAMACLETNRLSECEEIVQRQAETYPQIPAWRAGLALIYAQTGRTDAAETIMRDFTRKDLTDLRRDNNYLATLSLLAEVSILLSDVTSARLIRGLLAPYSDRAVVYGLGVLCTGSVCRTLGNLSAVLGDLDDARRFYEEGIQTNVSMGAEPALAYCEFGLGVLLLTSGADPNRGRLLLESARARASRLAMQTLSVLIGAQWQGLVSGTPTHDGDISSNPWSLTPREIGILALVAKGRTNMQIAHELFLSDKTVARHMQNILSKMGVPSRAAAAAAALRSGILGQEAG
jgi:DNA-binding CsgD family transcriptional regulator/tetratricopeptide (TPR) repeat protein